MTRTRIEAWRRGHPPMNERERQSKRKRDLTHELSHENGHENAHESVHNNAHKSLYESHMSLCWIIRWVPTRVLTGISTVLTHGNFPQCSRSCTRNGLVEVHLVCFHLFLPWQINPEIIHIFLSVPRGTARNFEELGVPPSQDILCLLHKHNGPRKPMQRQSPTHDMSKLGTLPKPSDRHRTTTFHPSEHTKISDFITPWDRPRCSKAWSVGQNVGTVG